VNKADSLNYPWTTRLWEVSAEIQQLEEVTYLARAPELEENQAN